MKLKFISAVCLTLVIAAAGLTSASAQNLISNGSFETGSFSNWTLTGNTTDTEVLPSGYNLSTEEGTDLIEAESGQYTAALGPMNTSGTLSQTISTTVGSTYTVSFYYSSDGDTPNSLSSSFGNVTGFSQTNIPYINGYNRATYTTIATTKLSTLSFNFLNTPGYLFLDNISVTAVPEFSSVAILALGFGLLILAACVSGKRSRIANLV